MRVLAVSYFLPPMQYPQAIQIGRLLRYLDAETGAVSGTFARLGFGTDCYPDLDAHLVFRVGVDYQPALSGLPFRLAQLAVPFYARSPDEFRAWVPRAERAVTAKLSETGFKPDVLVTFGEPMSDHLLGLRLKRRLGVPWVAHFSDPWVDSLYRRAEILANTVNRRLERAVIAAADRIVFTSAETIDLVMRKYPAAWRSKCSVVPHSYDAALYPAAVSRSGPLTARYLGNLFGRRTPIPLFRGLRRLQARNSAALKDWRFELVGRVPARHLWHSARRGLPDGFLGTVPTVPYTRSLALMAESDLLLVIDAADDLSVFLPSKLVEYLGAGVPIMGIVPPGASANLINELGGIVADPRDPAAIGEGLERALAIAQTARAARTAWGDAAIRSRYRIENVAAEFKSLLDDTRRQGVSGGGGGLTPNHPGPAMRARWSHLAARDRDSRNRLRGLGLGTAQFGMAYGRFNPHGQPNLDSVTAILRRAAALGFGTLDTAALYGESETVLGRILPADHDFRVVTKTPRFGGGKIGPEQAEALRAAFQASRTKLKQDRLYGLLAHDSDDLLAEGGGYLLETMNEIKRRGEVKKIGASVYTVRQIEGLLARGGIDLIQAPMSVLDQRLIDSGALREVAARGVELHVRSAYLQGLLLADPATLPPFFAPARAAVASFQRAAQSAGIAPAAAALSFLLRLREVDTVLVGVDSIEQLEAIAALPGEAPTLDYRQFSLADEHILDPSRWPEAVS